MHSEGSECSLACNIYHATAFAQMMRSCYCAENASKPRCNTVSSWCQQLHGGFCYFQFWIDWKVLEEIILVDLEMNMSITLIHDVCQITVMSHKTEQMWLSNIFTLQNMVVPMQGTLLQMQKNNNSSFLQKDISQAAY